MEAIKTLLILIGIVLALYGVGGVVLNQFLFTDECQLAEQVSKNADSDERNIERNDDPARVEELKAKAAESKKEADLFNQVCEKSNSSLSSNTLFKAMIGILGFSLILTGAFIKNSEAV
jgi:hypothetical protein